MVLPNLSLTSGSNGSLELVVLRVHRISHTGSRLGPPEDRQAQGRLLRLQSRPLPPYPVCIETMMVPLARHKVRRDQVRELRIGIDK